MPDTTEYSLKLSEIGLIDKDIKDQSLKPNSYDILASQKCKDPSGLLCKVYGLGRLKPQPNAGKCQMERPK